MTMASVFDELTRVVDEHAAAVAGLDASAMASTMHAVGGLVDAAQRFEVRAAAHFTALGAFRATGATSTAAWLRTHRKVAGGAAKQIEDAARAIGAIAPIRDAVERGAMSTAHAALLAGLGDRVRLGSCDVGELIPLIDKAAELPLDRFRQEVRTVEVRLDEAADHDPAVGNRVKEHSGDAGRKVWRAELDAESHATVGEALQALIDARWRAGTSAEDSSGPPTSELARRRADALVEMAHRSLHGVAGPDIDRFGNDRSRNDDADDRTPADRAMRARRPAPGAAARATWGRSRAEVAVLIDWPTLRDGVLRLDSTCRLLDGTPISAETARRIACEAGIFPAVLGGTGELLDLGRSQRLASPAQRRALQILYEHYAWPGCDVPVRWCKAHHVQPWKPIVPGAPPGETNLADLRPACERHHHLLHEGRWTMHAGPDGTTTTVRPPRGTASSPAAHLSHDGARPATQPAPPGSGAGPPGEDAR